MNAWRRGEWTGGRRTPRTGWPMFWPGLVLILFGVAILVRPLLLVAMVAALSIGAGVLMLMGGWRLRRALSWVGDAFRDGGPGGW